MDIKEVIEKIEKTVAILATPVAAIVSIWADVDVAIYTEATAGLVVSICEYVKLFLKD